MMLNDIKAEIGNNSVDWGRVVNYKKCKSVAMLLNAIIEEDEHGYFAFVPALKGRVS